MKTFVILGGAGFIGSHLVETFLNEGNRVIAIDNFITGSKKNVERFTGNINFMLIEHDITQEFISHISPLPGKVDYVLNFASLASPVDYTKHPLETLLVGSEGTRNALELAEYYGSRFMMASTSEVYGDPLVHPQTEDYWGNVNPVGARSMYDESKRYAEALTMSYQRTRSVDARIIRIFNTYGPYMQRHDGRAIPEFINDALEGKDIPVFGDGSQTRSFCYVDDLIAGIKTILYSDVKTPINCGNPAEMSILDLAKKIIDLTGNKSRIVFKPLPSDDPKVRRPDISRVRALGWEPKVSLSYGLNRTIEYFKSKHI